ncbi:hypothetical protein SynWH8101_0549 [Synechococcus sp. WH 8101]|nr:hypothetical protein SynWH8101_0549 [Synechococcus sp. WH 8101]QNI44359.1 hypothetical protein SynRCC2555_00558 [Synechococcus sp. WH 8101]
MKQQPQRQVLGTWIPAVPKQLLSSGADRHQRSEWSNDQ